MDNTNYKFLFENDKILSIPTVDAKFARLSLFCIKTLCTEIDLDISALQNTKFLLAVSGGVDSVAMLALFCIVKEYFGYSLHVAHFNHQIRKESKEEEKLIQYICQRLNVPFSIDRENVPELAKKNKMGLEEAGRLARYAFFTQCLQDTNSQYLCTAHHANDLAEDMLMRLIRGAMWPKLAGMPFYDPKRKLIRPLLYTPKNTLEHLVLGLHLPFAQDESNSDCTFQRNRIRHTIIPLLEKENPRFCENIIKLKQSARRDEQEISTELQDLISQLIKENNSIFIAIKSIQAKSKNIRMNFYAYLLETYTSAHCLYQNFENLDKAVMKNAGNTKFQFSHKTKLQIKKSMLILELA